MIKIIILFGGSTFGVIDITDPTFGSSEEGNASNPVVVVVFSEDVFSPGADYAAGVTIMVDGSPGTITSAVLQTDERIVYYTLSVTADANDPITWEYSKAAGDLEDTSGNELEDVGATAVTNNVGKHLRFNDYPNSMQLIPLGVL